MKRARRALSFPSALLILVIVVAVLVAVFGSLTVSGGGTRWRDDRTVDVAASDATPRDVLWEPSIEVRFGEREIEPSHGALAESDATAPITTDDWAPAISPDGSTLWFTRGRAGHGADDDAPGARLWFARRTATGWTEARPLEGVDPASDDAGRSNGMRTGARDDVHPSITPDGRTITFASDRPGGLGGFDLWSARLVVEAETIRATDVEPLGPRVNGPADELAPTWAPDGSALVFASNRGGGPTTGRDGWDATVREREIDADFDLLRAPFGEAGFAEAQPLDELNSDHDDTTPAFSPAGDYLWFASNRPGGEGGFDLFRVRLLSSGAPIGAPAAIGPEVNGPHDELDPALDFEGFALFYGSDRPEGATTGEIVPVPRERLFRALAREVRGERDPIVATFDASWLLPLLPWLALLALLLLLWWLWQKLSLQARLRTLGLLARCLILSLLAHALLAMLLGAWTVSGALADGLRPARGGTAQLSAPSGGASLARQLFASESTPIDSTNQPIEVAFDAPTPVAPIPDRAATPNAPPPPPAKSLRAHSLEAVRAITDRTQTAPSRTIDATIDTSADLPTPKQVDVAPLARMLPSLDRPGGATRGRTAERPPGAPSDASDAVMVLPDASSIETLEAPSVSVGSIRALADAAALPAPAPSNVGSNDRSDAAAPMRATPLDDAAITIDAPGDRIDRARVTDAESLPVDLTDALTAAGGTRTLVRSDRAETTRDREEARRPESIVGDGGVVADVPHGAIEAPAPLEPGPAFASDALDTPRVDSRPIDARDEPRVVADASALDEAIADVAPADRPGLGPSIDTAPPTLPGLRLPTRSDAARASSEDDPRSASAEGTPADDVLAPLPDAGAETATPADPTTMPDAIVPALDAPSTPGRVVDARTHDSDPASDPRLDASELDAPARDAPAPIVDDPGLFDFASLPAPPTPRRSAIAEATESNDDAAAAADVLADGVTAKVLTGRVRDAADRSIEGASVRLDREGQVPIVVPTDPDGWYVLVVTGSASELDFAALVAGHDGFVPSSRNVPLQASEARIIRCDFILDPLAGRVLPLEREPQVRHAGDDSFSGRINSEFQRESEGAVVTIRFSVPGLWLERAGDAETIDLVLLARGCQRGNRIVINGRRLRARLNGSPDDGSFGEFRTAIPIGLVGAGTNELRIQSVPSGIGDDIDDFEFVNPRLERRPHPDDD